MNLYSHITRLRKTNTFLLSLSASSELTEIKFTSINIECANLGASALVISFGSPSRFKTEIFPTLQSYQYSGRLWRLNVAQLVLRGPKCAKISPNLNR